MNSKFLTWATGKIILTSSELDMEALGTTGDQVLDVCRCIVDSGQLGLQLGREVWTAETILDEIIKGIGTDKQAVSSR